MGSVHSLFPVCIPGSATSFHGVSPFELLYGYPLRGLLQISREFWVDQGHQEDNVVQNIVETRERIQTMAELSRSPCPSRKVSKRPSMTKVPGLECSI